MTNNELEACIAQYGTDVYSFCRQLTQNRQEADDLYQDTFLKATEQSRQPQKLPALRRAADLEKQNAQICLADADRPGTSDGGRSGGTDGRSLRTLPRGTDSKAGRDTANTAGGGASAKPAEDPGSFILHGRAADSRNRFGLTYPVRYGKKQAVSGKNQAKKRIGGNLG